MEWLTDPSVLARLQFAMTVFFHFLFVPLSIGLGLVMAIVQTKAYRSGDPADEAAAQFWVRIFTATFAVGVATGITMEFAFGTNWAEYSRFVGDIFGAPLAAEALLAFFLESSFLGVLIFGKKKVSRRFYLVSSWLVWFGSALSALWILIANSWMQTPAGYHVENGRAVLDNFWAAAFNPSTVARYLHTVNSLLILGAFIAIAIGAYHLLKGNKDFGKKTLRVGSVLALVTLITMLPTAHTSAVVVAENQPEKLAALEGQWETGIADMSLVGWVDEENHVTFSLKVPIPGMTGILATGDANTVYQGIDDFGTENVAPVQITFQAYHLMVALYGVMIIMLIVALLAGRKGREPRRGALKLLLIGWVFPFLAINAGWVVAEVGRQPWIVWHELRTEDAISKAVSVPELWTTIIIFLALYLVILIVYLTVILRMIRKGPKEVPAEVPAASGDMSADEKKGE